MNDQPVWIRRVAGNILLRLGEFAGARALILMNSNRQQVLQAKSNGTVTLDQFTNDGAILEAKSTGDVAHGVTSYAETSVFLTVGKGVGAEGGALVRGLSENVSGLNVQGIATNDDTAKSTAARAYVELRAYKKDDTGVQSPGADANLLTVHSLDVCRFIFDAEGSGHSDVEWVTFDDQDDVALLAKLETTLVPSAFGAWLEEHKAELEALNIAHFDATPGHAMVNWTRLQQLQIGAIRQVAEKVERLERLLEGGQRDKPNLQPIV